MNRNPGHGSELVPASSIGPLRTGDVVGDRTAKGMTLIELMVAVALGMGLIAMTWGGFVRMKDTVARTTARVGLHATASTIEEALRRDLGNLAPALACFARSTVDAPDASTRVETVELVAMRTTAPLDKLNAVAGSYDGFLADHHWVRWRFVRTLKTSGAGWTVAASRLTRSESTPARVWKTLSTHTVAPSVTDPANGTLRSHYGGVLWLNIPRPLRDGTTWGIDGLTHNRYGVPPARIDPTTPIGDIDDLADLDANERTASMQVRSFAVGWSDAGGQAVTVSPGVVADVRRDGLHLDVVGPENGLYPTASVVPAVAGEPRYDYRPDLARRPRVMRVSIGMHDAATGVVQDFAFSVAAPGHGPATIEPSP